MRADCCRRRDARGARFSYRDAAEAEDELVGVCSARLVFRDGLSAGH